MFTYVCLGTNDIVRSAAFYDPVMSTLGLSRCDAGGDFNNQKWVGWGTFEDTGTDELALWICTPFNESPAIAGNGVTVALRADHWHQVQMFHSVALANGGTSEGEPGLRPQYGVNFYAAYVRDPDGNKLAAVCRSLLQDEPLTDTPVQPI